MEDLAIIALARSGDMNAFCTLVARYKHMVFTVANRVLRDQLDAEEVTQDVFIKIHDKLNDFHGTGKFSTWLYSIAYRTAISAVRRKRTVAISLDDPQVADVAAEMNGLDHMDRNLILENAMATLPPEDAAIVTMYHLEEMSVQEIVTVTGIGASNVKVKLHRSRKRLSAILHQQLKSEVWTLTTDG